MSKRWICILAGHIYQRSQHPADLAVGMYRCRRCGKPYKPIPYYRWGD